MAAESRALGRDLGRFATRREWLAAADGTALAERLGRLLGDVRRLEAPAPRPQLPRDWLHVVHWNVLHGEKFERVLEALRSEPALVDADVVSLNETDVGLPRSGNRDVAFELAAALGFHAAGASLFLELDAPDAGGRESLFGLGLLSRFPIGAVRCVELDSPDLLFEVERRAGRYVALVAEIHHPVQPFQMIVTHLDVHRGPQARARQVQQALDAVAPGPALWAGDLNTTTFARGTWWRSLRALSFFALAPQRKMRPRLLSPHRPQGAAPEPLFDVLAAAGFEVDPFNDATPSLDLRFTDVHELDFLPAPLRRAALGALRGVERRSALRLDWIAARGFEAAPERPPFALPHLSRGAAAASDHAPIGCGLRFSAARNRSA